VFNGEDVSPLYYVAALFYIITRLKTHDQIDEFFETLKRVFMDALDESHPPPCNQVIAVLHIHRQAYSKLKQLA
jgi:hypothetical protein